MRYVMKQKVWAVGNDFLIKDAAGEDRFLVDGKAFSLGDQLSFQDTRGDELAFIRQKLLAWGNTYEIHRGGRLFAVVKENWLPLTRYRFTVDVGADGPGPGDLEINGDFWAHEYRFVREGRQAAAVSMQWFSWSDTYGVDVSDGEDDVLILACTVVVDMCTQKHQSGH
jgi:uncharacterized protein YxjI